MADYQIGHTQEFTACSIGNGTTNRSNMNGGTGAPDVGLDNDNMDNISAMRTRLAAIDGTFYTAARMNTMTYNDMVYAVRVADNPTTIKQ